MGKKYLVVPATLVRSQVLVNNVGRCYLPPDAFTEDWARQANGAPVVTDHPTRSGREVSARDPNILNHMGVGFLFDVRVENDAGTPEMKGDVWLDVSRREEIEDLDVILTRLDEEGEPVELSTGFPALGQRRRGVHNGEKYDFVIYPDGYDHLAVFAADTGACGVEDGCGLGVNRRESARPASEIEFGGTETAEEQPWGDVTRTFDAYVSAYGTEEEQDEAESVDDLSADTLSRMAATSVLGDADGETFEDVVSVPVVNPSTDNLNEAALSAAAAAAGGARGAELPDPDGIQSTVDALREEHFPEEGDDVDEDTQNRLTALLRRALDALTRNQEDELSLDDRRDLVRDALDVAFGAEDRFVFVVELFESEVVYGVDEQGAEDRLFRAPYEIDGETEEVSFGERAEVEKVVEFVPVENERGETELKPRPEYLEVNPTTTTEEGAEADMNREQLVQALAEHEDVRFSRATLEAMEDEELAHVANGVDGIDADGGGGDGGEEPDPAPVPAGNADEGEGGGSEEPPEWARGLAQKVDSLAGEVESLKEATANARQEAEEEKQRLAGDVAANSEYEEDELLEKELRELRILHNAFCDRKPRSYLGLSGAGAADPSPSGGDDLGFEVGSTMGAGPHADAFESGEAN